MNAGGDKTDAEIQKVGLPAHCIFLYLPWRQMDLPTLSYRAPFFVLLFVFIISSMASDEIVLCYTDKPCRQQTPLII